MFNEITKLADVAKEKITRLGTENNSFENYMQAIGAEFELIGLILLLIICVLLIVVIPTGLILLLNHITDMCVKKANPAVYFIMKNRHRDSKYSLPFYLLNSEHASSVLEGIYKITLTLDYLERKKISVFVNQGKSLESLKSLSINEKDSRNIFLNGHKAKEILQDNMVINEYGKLKDKAYKMEEKLTVAHVITACIVIALWIIAIIPLCYILF